MNLLRPRGDTFLTVAYSFIAVAGAIGLVALAAYLAR